MDSRIQCYMGWAIDMQMSNLYVKYSFNTVLLSNWGIGLEVGGVAAYYP